MGRSERTCELLAEHCRTYPQLQIQDIFKYLYQSAFGCEHMVSSPEAVTDNIRREYGGESKSGTKVPNIETSACQRRAWSSNDEILIDTLDGAYSRVHLAWLDCGLSAETLGRLFFNSAKREADGKAELEHKLKAAGELARESFFPFSADEFEKALEEWRADGYPAVHHSDAFRMAYHPAYRVIADRYAAFLPLFAKLDEMLGKGAAVIAVEGGSASGKTTLSEMLEELYGCTVFHMDDFFLRPEQRTAERYAEPGGNVDRERFLEEVLIPLSENRPIDYRRFDCSTSGLASPVRIVPEKLTVIEGVYSMHPELSGYYDFSVFLEISSELQNARISKRNSPQAARRFRDEWIPLERMYFSQMKVKERCDMIFPDNF